MSFWSLAFLSVVVLRAIGDLAAVILTYGGAVSGGSAQGSFPPDWADSLAEIAMVLAGAMCALLVSRRWRGALISALRVLLLAASALLIAAALDAFTFSETAKSGGEADAVRAHLIGMAVRTMLLLLESAWLIWLLVQLQATARRIKRFVRQGQCAQCGYELHDGVPVGCPECGWFRVVDPFAAYSSPRPPSD
jgi:hypothetical protein